MAKQSSDKKLTISVDRNERAQHCSECHTKLLVQEYQDFYQDECSACRLGVFRSGGCDCGTCIPRTTVLTACPLCKFCKLHDNAPEWNNVRTKFECKKCRLYAEERQLVESHRRSVELYHRRRVEFYKKWHADPLSCYSMKKLRLLAAKKKLSGRSIFSREVLIEKLRPLLIARDLPIR